jgi:hypothetical protein
MNLESGYHVHTIDKLVNGHSHRQSLARLLIGLAVAVLFTGIAGNLPGALVFPEPPAEARAIVAKNIKQNAVFLRITNVESVTMAYPHKVYSEAAGWLDGVQFAVAVTSSPWTWQYLLVRGTNTFATAKIDPAQEAGGALRFAGLEKSRACGEILQALKSVETLALIKRQDYEVRLLDISEPTEFTAVWLHAKADDLFIPLPSAPGGLKPYQRYPEMQVRGSLKLLLTKEAEQAAQNVAPRRGMPPGRGARGGMANPPGGGF